MVIKVILIQKEKVGYKMGERLQRLTYKQILLVKGISFSLLLVASNQLFNTSLKYLALYVSMFVIRYIFSYNLEPYKYKIFPLWQFADYKLEAETLTDDENLMVYGADTGTEVYKLKTSMSYELALCLSSIASFIVLFFYYLNNVFRILGYIFDLMGYVYTFVTSDGFFLFMEVAIGIALILGLINLVKLQLKLNRASVKDQLKG